MTNYNALPSTVKGKVKPFTINIEEQKLQDFKTLLRLSPLVQDTYENQTARAKEGLNCGITKEWLTNAKKHWETEFDW